MKKTPEFAPSAPEQTFSSGELAELAYSDPARLEAAGLRVNELSGGEYQQIVLGKTPTLQQGEGIQLVGVIAAGADGHGVRIITGEDWQRNKELYIMRAEELEGFPLGPAVVSIPAGETKVFGRQQTGKGRLGLQAPTVSRTHFAIGMSEEGVITIGDMGSTNKTRVVTAR